MVRQIWCVFDTWMNHKSIIQSWSHSLPDSFLNGAFTSSVLSTQDQQRSYGEEERGPHRRTDTISGLAAAAVQAGLCQWRGAKAGGDSGEATTASATWMRGQAQLGWTGAEHLVPQHGHPWLHLYDGQQLGHWNPAGTPQHTRHNTGCKLVKCKYRLEKCMVWARGVCLWLEVVRSWCVASFAIIVGSYGVSPPLLSCNGLSFPIEVILSDWVFKDLRTLDVCLACAYLWWQWDIHVINLMYVLVINLRVQWPCELMHRGWHTFSSWLSGRNFGALFEILCVGWIDESEIVWCISYNHTHGYLRWHWSI